MPLVTTKEIFRAALKGDYAVGAYNFSLMELVWAITDAAVMERAPVILQISPGAYAYTGGSFAYHMACAAVEYARKKGEDIPVCLHLDHGSSFEMCKACVDGGFTSVMIDGSHLSFEENIALTRRVCGYAHDHGIVVEAELGRLAGIEDGVRSTQGLYTDPDQAMEFVERTGADSLAVAIGTSHGACKFEPGMSPSLRFDILDGIARLMPDYPLVLHGASAIDPINVQKINRYGGRMENCTGVPAEMLKKVVKTTVCKVNVDSDLRIALCACIREHLHAYPEDFDPRQYIGPARERVAEVVRRTMTDVLGCAGRMND